MPALDYAGIMRGGQSLVPDLRQQMMERELLDMQKGQVEVQRTQAALKQAEAIREAQEQEAFQRDLDAALLDGSPQAIQRLMLRYPSMADDIKPAWEAMDERQRQGDLTQLGTLYARAQAGDLEGAAAMLRSRIEADRAAGVADPADEAVLAGLESGDPIQQRAAMATMGIQLAALTGDKFAETYGKLNPADAKTNVQKEYDWRVASFGQEAADRWLATQDESLVAVEPGGSVYRKSDFVGGAQQPRGGDPASTGAGFALPVTGGTFTSGFGADRDGGARRHNGLDIAAPAGTPVTPVKPGKVIAVGSDAKSGRFVRVRHADGTTSSYSHLGQQNVQVGAEVGPGTSLGTVGSTGNATGSVLHLVIRDRNGKLIDPAPLFGGPVRVRSKQEYDKLAPGTAYIAPDGSQRVKS